MKAHSLVACLVAITVCGSGASSCAAQDPAPGHNDPKTHAAKESARGQHLEITDSKGNKFDLREAYLSYSTSYVMIDPVRDDNFIHVAIGDASTQVPWSDVYAALIYSHYWKTPRLVMKTGEIKEIDIKPAEIVGKSPSGARMSIDLQSADTIFNRNCAPSLQTSRAMAEIEPVIAKLTKNLHNGGVATFPNGSQKRFKSIKMAIFQYDNTRWSADGYGINRIAFSDGPPWTVRITFNQRKEVTIVSQQIRFQAEVEWADGEVTHYGSSKVPFPAGVTFAAAAGPRSQGK